MDRRQATTAAIATAAFGSLLLHASVAAAQEPPGLAMWAPRLYGDFQLGLFGDLQAESGDRFATDGLEPGAGGVVGVDVPVIRFFSIGAEGGATVWNTDGGENWDVDASVLMHVSVVPRFRVPWSVESGGHGAFYVAGIFGPSIDFLSADFRDALALGRASVDTGYGLHAGGLLGVQIFPVRHVGLDVGAGYVRHVVWHTIDGPLGTERDVRLDLGQLTLRAGLAIAL